MLKHRTYTSLLIACYTLLSLSTAQVYAKDDSNVPKTKSEAASKAQKKVRGRVLKVVQNKRNFRVKVLQKSGRVVSVDVDKKSGKVSQNKKKD